MPHADQAAITQLQSEMQQLKEMMTQLINQQAASTGTGASTSTAAIEQAAIPNTLDNESSQVSQFNTSTRQASVKEIAKTLPEFDPSDANAISVEQFIDRVDNVSNAYSWDDKFLLLAIYSQLKGPAKMWFDSSPVLHTSWKAFANALRDEFGTAPDEAEIHYAMTNAIRRAKETVKEYCFRMSALGVRYNISEAAVIRYTRSGLQHRELQQSIAAIKFTTMKQMRDTADEYFVNRGRLPNVRHDPVRRINTEHNTQQKQETEAKEKKPKESLKCFNCGEMGHFANVCPVPQKNPRCGKCKKFHGSNESCKPPEANVRRLGAENRDKWFTKEIVVQSKPYNAFIDTGSQARIVRKSVAEGINAD
ncbi:hypothetical protein ACLKA7_014690 [Drosophila subpalustris]